MGEQVRVLVADECALFRESLSRVLCVEADIDVVAHVETLDEARELAGSLGPGLLLVSLSLLGRAVTRQARELVAMAPDVRVIVLNTGDDSRLVQGLLAAGVSGCLHKGTSYHDLTSTIRSVQRNRNQVIFALSRPAPRPATLLGPLSPREQEVLALVAQAMTNRQIGRHIGITEETVKRHLRNTFSKLGAVSRIDAVNKAIAAAVLPGGGGYARAAQG